MTKWEKVHVEIHLTRNLSQVTEYPEKNGWKLNYLEEEISLRSYFLFQFQNSQVFQCW